MQVGTPGNLDKGHCIKCKIPLVVEIPGRMRFLCPECVRDINKLLADSKSNKNLKRTVLQPGQWRKRNPDGTATPLENLRQRARQKG